jgi:uncharacterized protein YqgQ
MEKWLEHTDENQMPNISRLLERYNEFITYLREGNYDVELMPDKFLSLYDNPELEFARVLNHDLSNWSVKVAKYMLVMNNEYEIKVKVE